MRSSRSGTSTRIAAFAALVTFSLVACHDDPPRIHVADVERCEQGVAQANDAKSEQAAATAFYTGCANVFAESACSKAMVTAASADAAARTMIVANGCRQVYCRALPAAVDLEMCQPDFKPTTDSVARAWPALQTAIVDYDADDLAPRVLAAMLRFFLIEVKWQKKPAAALGAPPAPGSAASPAPSATSTPAASGGPAVAASGNTPTPPASAPVRKKSQVKTESK